MSQISKPSNRLRLAGLLVHVLIHHLASISIIGLFRPTLDLMIDLNQADYDY